MSKLKNPTELGGMLGESASLRKVSNRLVVTNRPKRTMGKPTEKQETVQDKFQEAANYAQLQMGFEDARALYAAKITDKKRSAYVVAMTDFLIAPKVKSIDVTEYDGTIGSKIAVEAKDDFMVTRVRIVIADAAGVLLEQGDATMDAKQNLHWNYAATVLNPALVGTVITATAYDRPGNRGIGTIALS